MRYSTPLFGLVGAAAGLAVAAAGYQLAAAPNPAESDSSEPLAAVGKPLPAAPAEVKTRFAPCESPARLHRGACVTHVWRTTVVYDAPALPAPVPGSPTQGGAGAVQQTRTGGASHDDDRDDDRDEVDDDGGDDDHEEHDAGDDHEDDHEDEPEDD
ncbi:MAG: hypothetical protein ACXWDI_04310 [Nocardioides sp.]